MPQIGWLEILAVVIIAILVLGPKEFPIALKKIGSYIGKFKNTLSNFQREMSSVTSEIDIEKIRVVMIDCDLKAPTTLALNFIKASLQEGTIILFDDYIFYKGNTKKGEFAAFQEFQKENPNIQFREAFEYGYGSKAFIVSEI